MSRTHTTIALGVAVILAVSAGAQGQSAAPTAKAAPPPAPTPTPTTTAPPTTAPPAPSPAPTPAPTPTTGEAPPAPPAPTETAPPAPPAPAPTPAPTPAPAAAPAPKPQPPQTKAYVHLFVSYPNAQLELQSTVDDTGWRAVCKAPCDREIEVDATEARVSAPGMTTSNTFQIEPGRGTARFKVNGGSSSSRQIGIITLAAGIPIALTGMGLYGYGRLEESQGLRTAGIVTLAIGGATVIASLPFLGAGGTRVYDAKGKNVASRFAPPPL